MPPLKTSDRPWLLHLEVRLLSPVSGAVSLHAPRSSAAARAGIKGTNSSKCPDSQRGSSELRPGESAEQRAAGL